MNISAFKTLTLPYETDNFKCSFMAKNVQPEMEYLIATTVEDKEFFLIARETSEKKILLKTDKITRPSATYYAHQGLINYAKASGLDVIDTNVNTNEKNSHLEKDSALKTVADFADAFPDVDDVRIEVGFGSGRHLLHQAQNNPDILFIGLEIHKPSIEQVLKQINILGLDNLLLLDYDARLFMELVPSNLVSKIYVHFPVPWDKRPHRRVISETFIAEAIRVLQVGGRLELRTDSENYYAYSYETFIGLNKARLEINKNQDIAITSKYEDRWRKMEKNIYDITLINNEHSEPLDLTKNFEFKNQNYTLQTLKQLHNRTEKFENGFIHFERMYDIDEGKIMFRVSMGSFDRPEHLYLILSENSAAYFPIPPIKTASNLKAHNHLSELLHG